MTLERAILAFLMGVLIALSFHVMCYARDLGQWQDADPEMKRWYESLMMPDTPSVSCCGEADAYWADAYEVTKSGEYVAIITDTRDDEPLKRTHVDVGTRIVIPQKKLKFDQGNPTGHGIVFLSKGVNSGPTPEEKGLFVYCYLAPGGV